MTRFLILLPIALGVLAGNAQAAPNEGQQRLACMGDAFRLCPQHIPNREQIIQCLATQRASLSAGCRPVFEESYKALYGRHRS